MRRTLVLLLLPAILSMSAEAAAQTGKEEFQEAVRLFRAQKHEEALPLFVKAYELSGRRPATVLALAQCERALKMYDEALIHYREYLASKPRPKDSQSVLETVKLLEQLKRSEPKEAPPIEPPAPEVVDVRGEAEPEPQPQLELAPAPEPEPGPELAPAPATVEPELAPPPPADMKLVPAAVEPTATAEPGEGLSVAKISVLAAGAAAVIAGGVFAYRAASFERDAEDAAMRGVALPAEVRAAADRGFESAVAADALIGTGVVALVIGLWID
jgi:tetratricopeptide (TPR) repeat protein